MPTEGPGDDERFKDVSADSRPDRPASDSGPEAPIDGEIVAVSSDPDAEFDPIVGDFVGEAEPDDLAPITVNDLVDGAKDVIGEVSTTTKRLIDRGRYRKVRISRKGKPLLPDIPLAAVAAIEAASLASAGFARVFAANVGTKFLFDVEVVNEADKFLESGRAAFLDGDLETAERALLRAVRIDDTHAEAFLQLGVLRRMQGDAVEARRCFERTEQLDEVGDFGQRARAILKNMAPERAP